MSIGPEEWYQAVFNSKAMPGYRIESERRLREWLLRNGTPPAGLTKEQCLEDLAIVRHVLNWPTLPMGLMLTLPELKVVEEALRSMPNTSPSASARRKIAGHIRSTRNMVNRERKRASALPH